LYKGRFQPRTAKRRLKGEALVLGSVGSARLKLSCTNRQELCLRHRNGAIERVRQGFDILRPVPEGNCVSLSSVMITDISQLFRVANMDERSGALRPGSVDKAVELFKLPRLRSQPMYFCSDSLQILSL